MLLSTMPRSNRPHTPRVSRIISISLLCHRRIFPQASHTQTLLKGTMATNPDNLFSAYPAQPDKFDEEQSESWKEDTEGFIVFVCRRPIHSSRH
jgi:hypothetical protein